MDTPGTYISEYFDMLAALQEHDTASCRERCRRLHEQLDLLTHQLLDGTPQNYPNLFSRIAAVSRGHTRLHTVLNTVRLHTRSALQAENSDEGDDETRLQNDIRLMAYAVGELLHGEVPERFRPVTFPEPETEAIPKEMKRIRGTFTGTDGNGRLCVVPHDSTGDTPVFVVLSSCEGEENPFGGTLRALEPGMQVNLVHCRPADEGNTLSADIVVLEPDILLDISSVAECFKEYGAHPLNYLLGQLEPDKNSRHILLGNIANLFLDELVNERPEHPADYTETMQKAFRQNPFGIAACPDLQDDRADRQFFADCKRQFDNLCRIVRKEFPQFGIDRKKAMLEPAFICETLGLQGRLDLLCDDLSAFIELKSGRGREIPSGKLASYHENHYVQMLLYFAVLHVNLNVGYEHIRAFLLYSRYPRLYPMNVLRPLIKKALNLRNEIVAQEYRLQKHNSPDYSREVLFRITADELNVNKIRNAFWEKYLRQPADRFSRQLRRLPAVDQNYFLSLFTFITQERYAAKTGAGAGEPERGLPALWNASAAEKRESGEMITGLQLKACTTAESKQQLLFYRPEPTAGMPEPNFRKGDTVILYRHDCDRDHAGNRQIFKAGIESITPDKIILSLRTVQRNPNALPQTGRYAIERDYPEVGFSAMFRGLGYFLQADGERRELLLGQRRPRFNRAMYQRLTGPECTDLDRITAKALSAQDYFLLIGPPGTGKTSHALRRIVEEHLRRPGCNLLLIAYTHKAVDEICHSLVSIRPDLPFIRLGNDISCDPAFHDRLLDRVLASCRRRSEVSALLEQHRIIVSTLTTLSGRMELFKLKHFDVAVIDEASQILEPQLLGIACCTGADGRSAIDKFILIGDHKQLPAVVVQHPETSKIHCPDLQAIGVQNLRESLFERLYRHETVTDPDSPFIDRLTRQGRMHPEIGAFPAQAFYGGQLSPVPLPHQEQKSLPDIPGIDPQLQEILARRLAFVSVAGTLKTAAYKKNDDEARWVARLCTALYRRFTAAGAFVPDKQIGIITPYRSQIATIRKALEQTGISQLQAVTVDTVERFQGGQRDVMLFSCCVNAPFQLQFLCNTFEEEGQRIDRKLNVALTRAREQLIIIGNDRWLQRDPVYGRLIEHIRTQGGFFLADNPQP
ncbi:MAG: DNA2/NAM7 family helicase [Coprobacter sp.]|nr:DNA2/NAM7 family helicase [Coprobacter sp.]